MHFTHVAPLALALLSSYQAFAHPGHDVRKEISQRQAFLKSVRRTDLGHCAAKIKARGVEGRNIARRTDALRNARAKRGLKRRDLGTVLGTSHNSSGLGITPETDYDTLFGGLNGSCLLSPEATQGPYYIGGEYVRENIVEDQEGLYTLLDYQVIDVDTCDPVPDVFLEMWHCNSTGVYSGVVVGGNGNQNDLANINTTWLRGIQPTDADGVAQFETTFPGHYLSRANHIHLLVHSANTTEYDNSTVGNTVWASHVGQTFFDQDLISAVEVLEPYNKNQQALTLNADDNVLQGETRTDGIDPLMQYTLLGDDITDGLFGWIAFGINITAAQSISPSFFYYEEGGAVNPNHTSGAPGSPPPS